MRLSKQKRQKCLPCYFFYKGFTKAPPSATPQRKIPQKSITTPTPPYTPKFTAKCQKCVKLHEIMCQKRVKLHIFDT